MKRTPKLEICSNDKGPQRYWFQLVGGNGEILMASKKYITSGGCVRQATRCIDLMRAPTLTLVDMVE